MANLHERAIDCADGDRTARVIQALGIESSDRRRLRLPKTMPANRKQRARIIGEWQGRSRFLASPSIIPE
jgi:hypothetical protein